LLRIGVGDSVHENQRKKKKHVMKNEDDGRPQTRKCSFYGWDFGVRISIFCWALLGALN
jgi:hypothetical protein